jgi:phosphoribosylaminoimidazolecarboxamide formyltransferase/IMP cyclohydrolase
MNERTLKGATEPLTRQNLARKAFNHTAYYDGLISTYFNRMGTELFPKETSIPLKKRYDLRYGENPHQLAAVYKSYVDKNASILNAEILWGKQLSYNNVLDADACLDIVREFAGESRPFCVVIKHTNPCGASFGGNLLEAYAKALAGEPEAAFGGIVGFTRKVDQATAAKAIETFCEIVIAPDYDPDALDTFKTKKNLRIVKLTSGNFTKKGMNYRRVEGGMLAKDGTTSA